MSERQGLSVSGLLPIAGTGPGFSTPLFVSGDSATEYVQQIDEDGIVRGFIPANIPNQFPIFRSVAPEHRTVGDLALYGFYAPGNSPFVAEKAEIIELYKFIDPFLAPYPFIQSELANFVGDVVGIEVTSQKTARLLMPGSQIEDNVANLSEFLVSNGRPFNQEIQTFSMNSTYTIQNAVRFIDDLLSNDADDQFLELKKWANNTPFEFSAENTETLLHYVGTEAIYVSYLSGLKYNAPLAEPFSSPGQESIMHSSSMEVAMQRESRRHALFNRYANHDAFSSVTFQSIHSRVQGNFLDVRECVLSEEWSNPKLLSLVGARIAEHGYDGVMFVQPHSRNSNAFSVVSYDLKTVTSVIQASMFNLAHVAIGHPSWSDAIELV